MLVLVTRPRAQAAATAAALAAMGHEAMLDPALGIVPVPVPRRLAADGVAAVVLTSANAAPSLPAGLRGVPVFAVGAATAEAARSAGARDVRAGGEDGRALAAMLGRELPPTGEVLHLAGEEVRPGLEEALRAAGYAYRRIPVYRAEPSAGLGEAARAALREGRLGAALFFSPRSAAVWRGHVAAAGLGDRLEGVLGACLSAAVAAELRPLAWRALRVAAEPTQAALLRCLADPG